MFLAIFVAALLGSMIPMIFHHLKIDPAIAAGPIVLAINDIVGLLIFFGLATMLLGFIH
jgi:magnesium transporter